MDLTLLERPHLIYLALSSVGVTIAEECDLPVSKFAQGQHYSHGVHVPLTGLTLPARLVAAGIYTTDMTCQVRHLAEVYLKPFHLTVRDLVAARGFPHVIPSAQDQAVLDRPDEWTADPYMDQTPRLIWEWDLFSAEEPVEAFLERQVTAMLAMGRIDYLPLLAQERLTTAEAAELLGVNPSRVRQMLLRGQLRAQKTGRDWSIAPWDLIPVVQRTRGRPASGKPRKKSETAANTTG